MIYVIQCLLVIRDKIVRTEHLGF